MDTNSTALNISIVYGRIMAGLCAIISVIVISFAFLIVIIKRRVALRQRGYYTLPERTYQLEQAPGAIHIEYDHFTHSLSLSLYRPLVVSLLRSLVQCDQEAHKYAYTANEQQYRNVFGTRLNFSYTSTFFQEAYRSVSVLKATICIQRFF